MRLTFATSKGLMLLVMSLGRAGSIQIRTLCAHPYR